MPNECFNGDFRQRPNQNFSGNSRNIHRDQLIQHAALERKQREETRQHSQLAIRLQSQIRKFLARKKWFDKLRKEFDDEMVQNSKLTSEYLISQIKKLVIFYSHPTDTDRLYLVIRLLVDDISTLQNKQVSLNQWCLWLKNIFKLTSFLLTCLPEDNVLFKENLLLIIELFRNYLNSKQIFDDNQTQHIWLYLITNRHFRNLQYFFDKNWKTILSDSQLFDSVYGQFFYPLSIGYNSEDSSRTVVSLFLVDFLSKILNNSIANVVLLRITNSHPKVLNASNVLSSFDKLQTQDSYTFLWIFYASLCLLNNSIQHFTDEQIAKYLCIIRMFSLNLSSYIKTHNIKLDVKKAIEDFDEDDDEEEENKCKIFHAFIEQIFAILNNSSHCSLIVKYMNNVLTKDKDSLISLSYLCHSMLLFHPFAIHKNRLLHSLAFNSAFLKNLWKFILTESSTSLFNGPITFINILSQGLQSMFIDCEDFLPPITLFCALFNYFLQTLDDVEFFNECIIEDIDTDNLNKSYNYSVLPFKLSEIISMSSKLRDICISLIELAYQDNKFLRTNVNDNFLQNEYDIICWNLLLRTCLKLLRHIYARDIRRQFCPENHWISKKPFSFILPTNFKQALKQRGLLYQEFRGMRHLGRNEMMTYGSPIPVKDIINMTIIQELPFVMPFHHRVKIMQSIISFEKRSDEREFYEFVSHENPILIRRNYIYEDAFEKFSYENLPDLKTVVRIQLISSLGLEETGIDGGGVFREFLSETLKSAFDPNRGFFKTTTNGLLYPNPSIHLLVENSDKHYFFIGRLLGKAIFENMLVELPLAPFFLAKLLISNINSDVEINHLASLDPILYKSLISLKNYNGDVADLGLDFSTVNCEFGKSIIEELKPNGSNTPVTNQNKIEYIHLMADYKLNKQIRNQCAAFKQGFYDVVNLDWIKMFDTKEIQILISGAQTPIDFDDLINHTVYSGGYHRDHPVIRIFWEIVMSFDEIQKRKLLKFITSCSRPPLLGFKDLFPALCIQNAGKEIDRLPTSSTCMNLLKLPEVYDKDIIKEKLIYSINSASGFELS